MEHFYHTLNNGLRTVFGHSDSPVAHIGLIIGAGSRDEEKHEHGLAHFIEHTVFKGTNSRKAFHVLSYLENVGGELNAFTSREETCLYASVPVKYAERALELLFDVFANSTFPEKEIIREKDVVTEEIRYYQDLPDESILDDFEELVFRQHPLGHNILGTPATVRSFNEKKIRAFIANHYQTNNTIVSCVAGIRPELWQKHFEKHFSQIPSGTNTGNRLRFNNYQPFDLRKKKKVNQTHCVMGATAYSVAEKKKTGLVLLNNILGGPCNNSRLNMAIRERNGLSYNIESSYNPYMDTGIFAIYLGADHENANRAIDLVRIELKRLCNNRLGVLQLQRAKQQLAGQLAIAYESNLNEMLAMGKSMLIRGHVDSLEKIIKKIEALDSLSLNEIANEIMHPDRMSTLIYASSKSS